MTKPTPLKILLIDDDGTVTETLAYNLKRQGFDVCSASTGKAGLQKLLEFAPNLIILDWMLPDMIGPDICRIIRGQFNVVPVLMLTGRSAPNDIAEGLIAGADDYLSKPFSSVELFARIQALLRRAKGIVQSQLLKIGELELDEEGRRVVHRGNEVELSPKEFTLLRTLMVHVDKTVSTENLLNQVWGYDFAGDPKTVAVHIRWLRQKLEEDPKEPRLLETVHRLGYRLNSPDRQKKEIRHEN